MEHLIPGQAVLSAIPTIMANKSVEKIDISTFEINEPIRIIVTLHARHEDLAAILNALINYNDNLSGLNHVQHS